MRRAPEIVFKLDLGIEKGTSVLHLLGELGRERDERGDIPEGTELQDNP
jgi:ribosome-binding factor A